MSQRQRQYDQFLQLLSQAQAQQQTPSPYEAALGQQYQANHNYLYGGDLKNLPTGYNVNLLPAADERRMGQYGTGQAGTVAAGANPYGAINTQNSINNDRVTRNYGMAYSNMANQIGQTSNGMVGALNNLNMNRNQEAVQNGVQGLYNIGNRPKGFNWLSLIPGLASSGLGAAEMFA